MCKNKFFKVVLSVAVLANAALAGDFYGEAPGGFLWYGKVETVEVVKPPEDKAVTPTLISNKSPAQAAKARNDALKQKLEDAIQVVLDKPTLENAVAAQRMQKVVMERSEAVSQSWVLASLMDAGLVSPEMNPNVLHQALSKENKAADDTKALKAIAQDWGLFVYVMADCPYCEKFVPIVETVQHAAGFQVLAISKDGGNYGPFVGHKDTGLMQHLNPEGLAPVLYLVHKDGVRIYPVARGLTTPEKIQDNILLVHQLDQKKQKKQSFRGSA